MRLRGARTAKAEPEKKPVTSHAGEVGRRVENIVEQLKKQLGEVTATHAAPVAYEFKIVRDQRGLIERIVARPISN